MKRLSGTFTASQILRNSLGVSIIEALIALGLIGAIAAGIGTLIMQTQKAQLVDQFRRDASNLHEEIRSLLSSKQACFNSFGALSYASTSAIVVQSLNNNLAFQLSDDLGNVRYTIGTVSGKAKIARMELDRSGVIVGDTAGIGNAGVQFGNAMLRVSYVEASGANPNFTKPFDVAVRVQKNTGTNGLVECLALAKMSDGIWKVPQAGSLNFTYYTAGNVGIGTNNPLAGFDVQNQVTDAGGVANGVNFQQTLSATAANSKLTAVSINPVFNTNGNSGVSRNALVVTNGNVGIGTSAPAFQLEVGNFGTGARGVPFAVASFTANTALPSGIEISNRSGATNADARIGIFDEMSPMCGTAFANNNSLTFLMPSSANTASPNPFGLARSGSAFIFTNGSNASTLSAVGNCAAGSANPFPPRHLGIGTLKDRDLVLGTNNLQRMRIAADGRVAIGTNIGQAFFELDAGVAPNGVVPMNVIMTAQDANQNSGINNGGDFVFNMSKGLGGRSGYFAIDKTGVNANDVPRLTLRRSRTGPAGVQQNDILGSFEARGYDGTIWPVRESASVTFAAAEDFDNTSHGAYMAFMTTPTAGITPLERMRLDDAGNLGIGSTAPTARLHVAGDANITGNATVGLCLTAGGAPLGGACPSDLRLKKQVHPFALGLEALLGLSPKYYLFNGLGGIAESKAPQIGLIAQEVERVAPELVAREWVQLRPSDQLPTEIKKVNYAAFVYVLINAVKEFFHLWQNDSQSLHAELGQAQREIAQQREELAELRAIICQDHPEAKACH